MKSILKKVICSVTIILFTCSSAFASGPLVQNAPVVTLVNPTDYANSTSCSWQQQWRTATQYAMGDLCVTNSSYNSMTNYGLNAWGASTSSWQNTHVYAICPAGEYAYGLTCYHYHYYRP